ncbi:MAG TPA: hypothetical protein VGE52_19970 [Pirellulales bacterium]
MAEGRTREAWNHTSALLALLANIHRDPKKTSPFKPADFHPSVKRATAAPVKVGIRVLKQVFVDSRPLESATCPADKASEPARPTSSCS